MSSSKKDWLEWLDERLNVAEIFSVLSIMGIVYGEVDTSKGIRHALKEAFHKPIESYLRWPHILGILVLLLFIIEIMTGVLLSLYYQPTAASAFESVRFIVRDVPFGWLIHNIHRWAGYIIIIILVVRIIRFYYHGAYKSPREFLWIISIMLLLASLAACFTGNLLPWDQYSYWSVVRGLDVWSKFPLLKTVINYLFGGFLITESTLIRFNFLHSAIFPAMMLFLLFLHFLVVRKVGLSHLPGEDNAHKKPMYPHYYFNLLILAFLLLGVLMTLATMLPAHLYGQADPGSTFVGIHAPWYMLWLNGIFETLPHIPGVLIVLVFLSGMFFCPFIDKSPAKPVQKRLAALFLLFIILAFIALFTYLGYIKR